MEPCYMDKAEAKDEEDEVEHVSELSECLPFWTGGQMPFTVSTKTQYATEMLCHERYDDFETRRQMTSPKIIRSRTARFFLHGFEAIPSSYSSLDASHPWLCFWILHGLNIIGAPIPKKVADAAISILRSCQVDSGGFGGGVGQSPHLAATYAACMALSSIGTDEALSVIDVAGIKRYLERMRQPSGAFTISEDGEEDTRSAYCAIAVAVLLDIPLDPLFEFTAEWLMDCQTYEGGFGAFPGSEAHGGYTYCAFASLYLLEKPFLCDLNRLTRWLVFRQMRYEGGFQGRTNKLVDSCYSFWQGAVFPLLRQVHESLRKNDPVDIGNMLFDRTALQGYVIICCQNIDGGFCDKPGKASDYYHACYALAGAAVAQHSLIGDTECIFGSEANRLQEIHPAFNLTCRSFEYAHNFFKSIKAQLK
ncbi:protein farnesyltransferase subunit beta-like [Paramacrobiotus metropolitanus]|uniref:protein farnesyltransferase subunit beta-like n=1 Tax=Paramacrobiotus metropolitanus TaxID=2943436 RepID=UPI00244577CB|nr:protein farnesyltransferase subunit beta-like [Paramacrobiotus metropolitanus]XP_055342810.1 protein farnesyltransferase subunit beta-like [Paramacrobiotus metropolitanus]XP_055342811.1 protein farnesyltransferase subunit beta-like [Paramacrobiotus metropolitanus]